MMKSKSKSEEEQRGILIKAVRSFYKMTQTKKNVENAFNEEKVNFENLMDVLYKRFSSEDGDVYVDGDNSLESTVIRVHKVQSSKVEWDSKKLRDVLGEEYSEKVITKKYTVNNFPLLIKLAKEHNIPWKEFKKCIEYEDVVKDSEIDKLVELGLVDEEEVKGCANVKLNKPYYRLTEQ